MLTPVTQPNELMLKYIASVNNLYNIAFLWAPLMQG